MKNTKNINRILIKIQFQSQLLHTTGRYIVEVSKVRDTAQFSLYIKSTVNHCKIKQLFLIEAQQTGKVEP